jgi:hypothetical protein
VPYDGYDPEVSNFGNQPIMRNIDVAPAEAQFLVQRGHRLLTRRPEETAMRTSRSRHPRAAARQWVQHLDVPDLNNPGQDEWRTTDPRSSRRDDRHALRYAARYGGSERIHHGTGDWPESYNLDPPTLALTELLVGPLDGGSGHRR